MSGINKMKQLKYLTINEFNTYTELLKEEPIDKIAILDLFGLNIDELSPVDIEDAFTKLSLMDIPEFRAMKVYDIKGKDGKLRRFSLQDNIHTMTGGQFIDFQSYAGTSNIPSVLSVFMLPMYKTWYGRWKTKKYGKDYSVFEVQKFLAENMMIGDATGIAAFFFSGCLTSLQLIRTYSEKALKEKTEKRMKSTSKSLLERVKCNGSKLLKTFQKS